MTRALFLANFLNAPSISCIQPMQYKEFSPSYACKMRENANLFKYYFTGKHWRAFKATCLVAKILWHSKRCTRANNIIMYLFNLQKKDTDIIKSKLQNTVKLQKCKTALGIEPTTEPKGPTTNHCTKVHIHFLCMQ